MGETLAETRVEIEAQRAELSATAAQLRDALDLKQRFKENPAVFVGLAAGAVFLAVGGPIRVARLARRRLFRSRPEEAYDALPKPMQAWVDGIADSLGPRAQEARDRMSRELLRWRHDPRKHGKVSKKLAKELADGPPGPGRTGWKAFEAAAAILSAALARKAVERFLSTEPPSGNAALDMAGTAGGAGDDDGKARRDYSGMSARSREGAG